MSAPTIKDVAAAAGVSTADELQKLNDLRSAGVINDAEYEDLKKKALA